MLLSSDSMTFFKRQIHSTGKTSIGWRIHCNLSDYTHVSIQQMNIEPYNVIRKQKMCKVYCNLVTSSQTDPYGTIAILGGLQYRSAVLSCE